METQKFARRQFALEAVQVTPTNMNEVARWCSGKVAPADYKMMGGVHKMPEGCVLLPKQGLKANKTYKVLIGHWITKHNGQFRTWTLEAFEASFEPVTPNDEFKKNDLVKVLPHPDVQPWEGWEGKVVDAVLVGVDFGRRGLVVFEPSRLTKISEMDSLQLEFNAGIEIASSPEAMLEQMREESKDKIEALEKKNLEYDENEIREGDFVKVVNKEPWNFNEHSKKFIGQFGDVIKIGERVCKVTFATADPDHPEVVTVVRNNLEKVVQDGEAPFDMAIPPAEERAVEVSKDLDVSYLEALKLVHESDCVTINQFREQLGMPALGEKGDELLSPEAIEHFRTLTTEDFAKFVTVQKIGEEEIFDQPLAHMTLHEDGTVEQHVPLDVAAVGTPNVDYSVAMTESGELVFEAGDLVETLVEHEFDGVTIPVGTNARVCVIGVDQQNGYCEGIEVLFASGHYHVFSTNELKKI